MQTTPRILYVFTGGRKVRLVAARRGEEAPMEFLFGVTYLQRRGYDVDLLELTDLSPDQHSQAYTALVRQNTQMQQATGFTGSSHYFLGAIDLLNQYDAIIACGESVALGLSHFIRQGKVRPSMFLMAMGMLLHSAARTRHERRIQAFIGWLKESYKVLVRGRDRKRRRIYRDLLESSAAGVYFERSEYEIARHMCSGLVSKMHLWVAPVDTEFWRPGPGTNMEQDVILFMGNDRERDFDLVIEIAKRLPHRRFVFVTDRIQQDQIPQNVSLRRGDWKKQLLSDLEVREIVQNCAVVVLPFKAGALRTLTSVALQAMACGKTVLVSKTSGCWEPEFIDRQHVWFIHSGKLDEWCESIETLMRDSAARARIGADARDLVEGTNNVTVLGQNVEALLTQSLQVAVL